MKAIIVALALLHLFCLQAQQTASTSVNSKESKITDSNNDNNKPPQQQQSSAKSSSISNGPKHHKQQHQEPSTRRQWSSLGTSQLAEDEYLVGVGIADITGPAADINLMGYAKPNQDAGGIHLRQFCRSILIEDQMGSRVLYVNLDNGMISQLLRTTVIDYLKHHYGPAVFNETNVMLTATHTHSCPGGFFQYMLYNIPSAGFIRETLDALTGGILRSIERSVASLQPARIYFNKGELLDASINRSPTSYANNPKEERAKYAHDTDKEMFLLRVVDRQQKPLAMVNWFAVHGTSMNNSNHLISSDNKGYAALLFEQDYNQPGTLPGKGKFVAIFAQANEGDVSPNTQGPRCIDTGLPCDPITSTCGNPPRNEKCIASGPGRDMFESTQIIAYKQYYKARQLFQDLRGQQQVRGPVRHVHEHIDITQQQVPRYESAVKILENRPKDLNNNNNDNNYNSHQNNHRQVKRQQKNSHRRRQLILSQSIGEQQDNSTTNKNNSNWLSEHSPQIQNNGSSIPDFFGTCRASLGYSFAAGTTDGPGAFDFQQGDTVSTRYWNLVRDFLKRPSPALIKCQHPKPILLATGQMDFPYMWHPRVVPTQLFLIGQVAVVGLPGEFTTMSGRRVREAVQAALASQSSSPSAQSRAKEANPAEQQANYDPLAVEEAKQRRHNLAPGSTQLSGPQRHEADEDEHKQPLGHFEVVLSGLSNIYTSYITTIEEYEMQRYEGGSTLYGPHTLQAYVDQFTKLAHRALNSTSAAPSDESLTPPDLSKSLFTLKAGVIYDGAPHGKSFGSLIQDAQTELAYKQGDLVQVSFVAGSPRNDLRQEESFLYIEQFNESTKTWSIVATDASWETKFIWQRTNTLLGESLATIEWQIPNQAQPGIYRVRHIGAHKSLLSQTIANYAGRSSAFKVISLGQHQDPIELDRLEAVRLAVDQMERPASELEAVAAHGRQAQASLSAMAVEPKSDSFASNINSNNKRNQMVNSLLAPIRAIGRMFGLRRT